MPPALWVTAVIKRRLVTVSPSKAPGIPRSAVYFEDCLWRSAGIYLRLLTSLFIARPVSLHSNAFTSAAPPPLRHRSGAPQRAEVPAQQRFRRWRAAARRARSD